MGALEIIRALMNEFSEVKDSDIEAYITLMKPQVNKKRFGKSYDLALAYLVAHKMKMNGLGAQTAVGGTIGDTIGIASLSEGESSVSFSNNQTANTSADAEYGLTVYGMQFLQMRRNCIVSIISAGEGQSYGL